MKRKSPGLFPAAICYGGSGRAATSLSGISYVRFYVPASPELANIRQLCQKISFRPGKIVVEDFKTANTSMADGLGPPWAVSKGVGRVLGTAVATSAVLAKMPNAKHPRGSPAGQALGLAIENFARSGGESSEIPGRKVGARRFSPEFPMLAAPNSANFGRNRTCAPEIAEINSRGLEPPAEIAGGNLLKIGIFWWGHFRAPKRVDAVEKVPEMPDSPWGTVRKLLILGSREVGWRVEK